MRGTKLIIRLSVILFACTGIAFATTLTPGAPQQQPSVSGKPGWSSKCVRESRKSPEECYVEEILYVSNTAQPIASVAVRIGSDKANPTLLVRVPVGLFLPAGVNVQIDDGKPQSVTLQTCDAQSCYGELQLSSALISALMGGKQLSIIFQNMTKKEVKLPFPLENFDNAYKNVQ
jgi:invasion protein IalB